MQDTALREKLRKIEALFAGAATPGERDAAEAAMLRVRAHLAEIARSEQPVEMQFSIQDQWAQHLFIALCRRYGPLKAPEQRNELLSVMQSLETMGWLKAEAQENPARPPTAWEVNPLVRERFARRAAEERTARQLAKARIAATLARVGQTPGAAEAAKNDSTAALGVA